MICSSRMYTSYLILHFRLCLLIYILYDSEEEEFYILIRRLKRKRERNQAIMYMWISPLYKYYNHSAFITDRQQID